ncbi:TIR domain-containing protein [Frankia sp. CiP3]|uniref:nSTAND1 domain-containing NTPase n=1 Tax=Frankia sp. CiP3 TaxID=2880971 RepID=UPI001EF3F73C|nr:TIR domain-containing protein [Frankia sp. CiP3]
MARVFVSHASDGAVQADVVHRWLVEGRHEVFLDLHRVDGIPIGEDWRQTLHGRLRWADAVVCIVTENYKTSTWCKIEAEIARSRGILLVPITGASGVRDPSLEGLQVITSYESAPERAREDLLRTMNRLDARGGWGWPDGKSPFPGLLPFTPDLHRVFFGRDQERRDLIRMLRASDARNNSSVILLVGPSGCGKSSLLQAGVMPAMAGEAGWQVLPPIRPSQRPLVALSRALAEIYRDGSASERDQTVDTDFTSVMLAARRLRATSLPGQHDRILIAFDQFEEVINQANSKTRAELGDFFRQSPDADIQLIATLRSEFLDQILTEPAFLGTEFAVYTLASLPAKAIRTVVESPVAAAGMKIPERLLAQIVEDSGGGEGLPLLAFTLSQITAGLGYGSTLSEDLYRAIGGVQGALINEAQEALKQAARMSGTSSRDVIDSLLRLVDFNDTGQPTRRRVDVAQLSTKELAEFEVFVERRLLYTDSTASGRAIMVSHEALFSAWPPLQEAIDSAAKALKARAVAERLAAEWDSRGRTTVALLEGGRLASIIEETGIKFARLQCIRSRITSSRSLNQVDLRKISRTSPIRGGELSPLAAYFIRRSLRRETIRRSRAVAILSILLSVAVAGAIFAFVNARATARQQKIATSRQLLADAHSLEDSDPNTSISLALVAYTLTPTEEFSAGLTFILSHTHYRETLAPRQGVLTAAAFAPHQSVLATTSDFGYLNLWTIQPRGTWSTAGRVYLGHDGGHLTSVAFSGDGERLAVGSSDGAVTLWNVANPNNLLQVGSPLDGGTGSVNSVAVSPDGQGLAAAGDDGKAAYWRLDGTFEKPVLWQLSGHSGPVNAVAFSANHLLATASDDGTVLMWDCGRPVGPSLLGEPLRANAGAVTDVAFTPSGNLLATANSNGSAILWSMANPAAPTIVGEPLIQNQGLVTSVAFSPDGDVLGASSNGGTTALWELNNSGTVRNLENQLAAPQGAVTDLAFSNMETLVTTGIDGTAILWTSSPLISRFGPPVAANAGSVHRINIQATMLSSQSSDGSVTVWDIANPARPQPIRTKKPKTQTSISEYIASSDTRGLSLSDLPDGSGVLWATPHGSSGRDVLGHLPPNGHGQMTSAAFSARGTLLATGYTDGTTVLWRIADAAGGVVKQVGDSLTGHGGAVSAVAVSDDERTVASAFSDGEIQLWDLTDPKVPQPFTESFTGGSSEIDSIQFGENGGVLAAGASDGFITLWDTRALGAVRDDPVAAGCKVTGGGLAQKVWTQYVPYYSFRSSC